MVPFWVAVQEATLAQGDLLPECRMPLFSSNFGLSDQFDIPLAVVDFIVMTQTCDLANLKTGSVALCPIQRLAKFEAVNPNYSKKGQWEQVRKGRVEALHLLASPENPQDNRDALVVDFRNIVSLPFAYLTRRVAQLETRWRLQSPFLEHFSQAFARFFMRVGLPAAIPPYK